MSKPTPAPWIAFEDDDGVPDAIARPDGTPIIRAMESQGLTYLDGPNIRADIRLAAASPTLLEAVKSVIGETWFLGAAPLYHIEKFRSAIAEAEEDASGQ